MNRRTWAIACKEYLHIVRDPRTLLMILCFPIFFLVLFGYAVSFDVKHLPLAVLDQDRSAASRELISGFTRAGYFDLVEHLSSSQQFADRLDGNRAKVILNIPADFSNDVKKGIRTEVQVILDGTDPTVASAALTYLNGITEDLQRRLIAAKMVRFKVKAVGLSPIGLRTRVWYNPDLRSLNFFIPGLICVILMLISAALTSVIIVSEKELGTMEKLVISPVRKTELMVGKLLPYSLIAFLDILLVIAVGHYWFRVPIKGDLLLLAVSSFIFLFGSMAIGLLISVNSRTSPEAIMTAMLITLLPTTLLSGFIFPVENMPWPLQVFSLFLPARYFLVILRGIFLKGVGLPQLWPSILALTLLTGLVVLASERRFKKRVE
ncbi:MAG: ABC transporter permease [Candidatus Margulisiibacteriota bacterium]